MTDRSSRRPHSLAPTTSRLATLACLALAAALPSAHATQPATSAATPAPTSAPASTTPTGATLPRRQVDPAIIRDFAGHKTVTRPSQDAVLGFSIPTDIREVLVRGGQEVSRGQLLIRGDDTEDQAILDIQKLRAETNLPVDRAIKAKEQAEKEYEITLEAQKRGGSSPQQVDRARVSAEVAAIDVELAKQTQKQEALQVQRLAARVDKFRLRAPFDGTVEFVQSPTIQVLSVGQAVSENDRLIRIVDLDPLVIDVPARTEDQATLGLEVGAPAWVLVDSGGLPRLARGRVTEVNPTADPASRSRVVRVELPNPKGPLRVLPGEPAWVRFSEPPPSVEAAVTLAQGAPAQPGQP